MSKRTLEVTLVSTSGSAFDVEIYEPESGEFMCINCHDNGSSVKEEDEKIVNEIRSWVKIMRENEV